MGPVIKDVFGTVDYLVFTCMLVMSAITGIWFAYVDRNKNTTQEFLLGGRSLKVLPVAMSITASYISAIALLGGPAEVYRYGTQYVIRVLGACLMIPTTAYLYMPVYYRLGLTSAYEYLELRFHRGIRLMAASIFVMYMLIYISVVLYAPALALSEVTGIGLSSSVITIGAVCTFYTSIGGIKAVVWTDFFQTIIMYTAMAVVILKGVGDIGGFGEVWRRSVEGQRVEFFRFDWDPTVRHTFWNLLIGGYIMFLGNFAASQSMIQRYLSIGSLQDAQKCIWINLPALSLIVSMSCFSGLVVFAYYSACDPIGTKIVNKPDQVFPRFVMETFSSLPGVPGLFVSGIFSGSLSSVSTGVNSLAAVVLEDFIKPSAGDKLSDSCATTISKFLAVLFGIMSILLVFVAQQLGGILQSAATIHGVVGGPMLGLFTLGLFFPYANIYGASAGFLTGFLVSVWFGFGAFISKPYHPQGPMSYQNCTELYYNVTNIDLAGNTTIFSEIKSNADIFYPYRLSYMWLSFIGFVIVLGIGNIVSLLTGSGRKADNKFLSPLVIWLSTISSSNVSRRFTTGSKRKDLSFKDRNKNETCELYLKEISPLDSKGFQTILQTDSNRM